MAYRNGTYVAFHANNTEDPTESDMKYYRLLTAWSVKDDGDFSMINSHEKTNARDWASQETLRNHMRERLRNSRNMLLIIGQTTRFDSDWIPFEISFAVDDCQIPIIVAYPGYLNVTAPQNARRMWPSALAERIDSGNAKAIHVSFRKEPLAAAINAYGFDNLPEGGLIHYTLETYQRWGLT